MITRRTLMAVQTMALLVACKRLLPGARRAAPLRATSRPEGITVSVLIPARNEALRLGACLESLERSEATEVIVVDDESTDATAKVARNHGANVIPGVPLPSGWVGKPWALQQALDAAKAEYVVTLDADTVARPGLLGAMIEQLRDADVVTAAPLLHTNGPVDQAVHASMLASLVLRYGAPSDETTSPERIYGNGQCMAFRRKWLVEQGGFALAGSAMTDDIALLRALAARGGRVRFADGRDVVEVHMYTSARETLREWSRSLPMTDTTPPVQRYFDVALVWLVQVLPLVRLLRRRLTAVDVMCMMLRGGLVAALRNSYSKPRVGLPASIAMDLVTVPKLTLSTLRPVRTWRGRRYDSPKTERR